MSLIKSFAEAQQVIDEDAAVTRKELRDVLSNSPIPLLIKQSNLVAQEMNNLQFRWNTLMDYLEIRGMRRKKDGAYVLDRVDWEAFLNQRIKEVNAQGTSKPS